MGRQRQLIVAKARSIGIEVAVDVSRDADECLLKLSAPDALLELAAEHLTMEKRLKSGGYTDYLRSERERFAPADRNHFFSSLERIRLLLALLELSRADGGAELALTLLVEQKVLTAVVPIHDINTSEGRLMETWCRAPWQWVAEQPLDDIRDYLGESISFYFAFIQLLTRFLIWPALAGPVVVMIAILGFGSMDNVLMDAYAIFALLWMTIFCKAWRREEARLAHHWNVEDYEATQTLRHQFQGPLARGFYTHKGYFVDIGEDEANKEHVPLIPKFTPVQRLRRSGLSYFVILPMVVAIIIGTMGILAYRSFIMFSFYLSFESDHNGLTVPGYGVYVGSMVGGALNGIFISGTNSLYGWLARRTLSRFQHACSADNILVDDLALYTGLVGSPRAWRPRVSGGSSLSRPRPQPVRKPPHRDRL